MITISGTVVLDQTPKGGASVDLMTSLLRASEAAEALAQQAKIGRNALPAESWSDIPEHQIEVMRRTAAAVERRRDESHAGTSDEGETVTDELKTVDQRGDDPKGGA
jgi:hypothetical protein